MDMRELKEKIESSHTNIYKFMFSDIKEILKVLKVLNLHQVLFILLISCIQLMPPRP